VAYDPQWDEPELHQQARRVLGVPADQPTSLQMVDQCAQSDTEPNWLPPKTPRTNEELLEWMNAPIAGASETRWGRAAAERKRAELADQERIKRLQQAEIADRVRKIAARPTQEEYSVMYGVGLDRTGRFAISHLKVRFEDEAPKNVMVRTDIPERTLMTAIARMYEVGGEMELDVQGLSTIHRYDVCENAQYTLYRVDTARRKWAKRILHPQ
jgi:hypothetical protein